MKRGCEKQGGSGTKSSLFKPQCLKADDHLEGGELGPTLQVPKPQCLKGKVGLEGGATLVVGENIPLPCPKNTPESAQKKSPRKSRPSDATRSHRRRGQRAEAAAHLAISIGKAFTYMVTLTWSAFDNEEVEGRALWLSAPERERVRKIAAALSRTAKRLGFEVAYIAAQAYGGKLRYHLHLGLFWPSRFEAELITVIERGTGVAVGSIEASKKKRIIRSPCRAWQVDWNWRGHEGAIGMAYYIGIQVHKHTDTKARIKGRTFCTSRNLWPGAQSCSV